tara:strand:+ start:96 stop:290 length:195 start_codon:yes stop_codon:yes gene_type:complete
MIVEDIEGNILEIGATVYYARKRSYSQGGELIECTITAIRENGHVGLGKYTSKYPETQLIKKKG